MLLSAGVLFPCLTLKYRGFTRFFLWVREERGIVAVLRAVRRDTASTQIPVSSHVRQVRSCLFGRLFLVLHRNIAVLHVSFCGGEKTQDCRCSPRCSANNFVRAALANSHVRQVRSCLLGRFFLVLHRNIAVLHVSFCGRGKETRLSLFSALFREQLCQSRPRKQLRTTRYAPVCSGCAGHSS